jgi:lipopolysaccharide export system permease protein
MDEMHDQWAAKAALQMMTGDGRGLHSQEWSTRESLYEQAREMVHRLRTESYRRWSNGFSCLCFVLVGAPLAMRMRNSDVLTTFFLCFLPILIVYYPMLMLGVDRAKLGTIPPVAVWLGNAVLLVIAIPLWRRVIRY